MVGPTTQQHSSSCPAPAIEVSLKRSSALAEVGVWGLRQLAEFLRGYTPREFDAQGRPPGFSLLNQRFVSRFHRSEPYPDPATLPDWQRQSSGAQPSSKFDRAIVATVGPCLAGILYCEWKHFKGESSFWGYHLAFVDVHESWRGLGIASILIRELDKQPWLQGRILQLSSYTREGYETLRPVIGRELRAQSYMMLSSDYYSTELPPSAGRWVSESISY
jgi:hypothetical protein